MNNTVDFHRWFRIAFAFLIIAAFLGATLRLAFVVEMPLWFKYRNITHAHSHIAMMGWLYCALLILIVQQFRLLRDVYRIYFWGSVLCSMGMMISFPIQGYGLYSIFFTSAHLVLSYGFIISIFRDLKPGKIQIGNYAGLFLKTSLIFLFCSSLGTWMIGIMAGTGMRGSALYYGSIQFFLHFQFNGWFIFSAIAIFLKILHDRKIVLDEKSLKRFYFLLAISSVLTYALAVTWSTPDQIIFYINSAGVIIQFVAIIIFLQLLKENKVKITSQFSRWANFLLIFALSCFSIKVLIQTLVAIPYIATISYTVKNFVIGFIHLLMLGGMSCFLLGIYTRSHLSLSNGLRLGISIFILGFVLSEAILFMQGLLLWMSVGFMPGYYLLLFIVSAVMAIGIAVIGISFFYPEKSLEQSHKLKLQK